MKRQITNGHIIVKDRDLDFLIRRSDGLRVSYKPDDADRKALAAQSVDFFERRLDDFIAGKAQFKHLEAKVEQERAEIREAARKGIPIEQVEKDPEYPGAKPVTYIRVMPWYRRLHCWLSRPISLHKRPEWMTRSRYEPFFLGILSAKPKPAPMCRQCKSAPAVESGIPGEPKGGILCPECLKKAMAGATVKEPRYAKQGGN